MATHKNLSELFAAIADAIRVKTGGTDPIVADNFPAAILSIVTRPSTVDITADNIGDYFTVSNDTYHFAGNGSVFTTNNGGVNSTTAATTLTALFDMEVSFTYSYSSEKSYDKFLLTVAGATIENWVSGSTTTRTWSGELKAGQTIEFKYAKDGSSSSYDDRCTFSDMSITGYFSGSGSSLPSGYTQLDYIESTGTQYIDTSFKPNNNTRVVVDVSMAANANALTVFGARTSATSANYALMQTADGFRSDYNNTYSQTWSADVTERRVIDKNKETTIIDSVSQSYSNASFQTPVNLFLFALNNNGKVQWHTKVKMYTCQIYDNGTLVRDFAPCKNASGAFGMYDRVNGQFYGNAGTGAFAGA